MFQPTLKTISQTYIDKAEDETIEEALRQARELLLYIEGDDDVETNQKK